MDDDSSSFLGRHQFLIYRLFSLAGIVPIGGYLVIHLLTNATVLNGPEDFQRSVDAIHGLGIFLPILEWGFIFLPILFHAVIGIVIISGAMPNTFAYPYPRNFRYTLQRITGMIAFAFIIWHVIHMHQLLGAPFKEMGGARFDPHHATSTSAEAIQAALWVQIAYAVGVLACVYHLANGIWTFGITWGIWTTAQAQKRADYVCIALGIGLAIVGLSALWGMSSVDVAKAREIEQRDAPIHSPGQATTSSE